MDWYRQWFACDFLQVFPASVVLLSSLVLRSIKSLRFPFCSGEAVHASVFAPNLHPESGEILTSRRLMRAGMSLVVRGLGDPPSDHESVKYLWIRMYRGVVYDHSHAAMPSSHYGAAA
jgi:hypothetical protein